MRALQWSAHDGRAIDVLLGLRRSVLLHARLADLPDDFELFAVDLLWRVRVRPLMGLLAVS